MKFSVLYLLLSVNLFAVAYYSEMKEVDSGVKKMEIERSCQAGVLFYVTQYPEELPLAEKNTRIRYISKVCGKLAKTYMEIK